MPSAKIIILKTIVINPKFFKICFIVTITTQDTEFMCTDFFVILCSKFHQLLHLGISTYRRPTCQSITQSRNMAQSLAVATVHIVTNIREYGRKSQIFDRIINNISIVTQLRLFYISFSLIQQSQRILVFEFAHILIPCTILISYRISRVSTSCLAIYPTSEATPTSCRFHLVFLTKQTEFQLQLIIKHTVGYLNTSLKTFEIRFFHDPLTRGIVQVGNIISL